MKIAVGMSHLEGSLKQKVQKICSLPVDGLCFDFRYELKSNEFSQTAIRELRKRLSEFGMVPGPGVFPLRHGILEPDNQDARIQALKSSLELAGKLGTQHFRIDAGVDELHEEMAENQPLIDILDDLAAYGDKYGVILCVCLPQDKPQTLISLCKAVTRGRLKLDFDPLFSLSADEKPSSMLRELHTVLGHVTGHDGTVDSRGRMKESAIGRGEVNFDEMIVTLDEIEYSQWMTMVRESGQNPETDIRNAIQFVKAIRMEY